MTMAEWWVWAIRSSQRWDPMKPPPPIKQMVRGVISLPSKSSCAIEERMEKFGGVAEKRQEKREKKGWVCFFRFCNGFLGRSLAQFW